MFCKSGILIFIFAENYYNIYAHASGLKHLCSIRALVPVSFFLSFFSLSLSLSVSLSLFLANSLEHGGPLSSLSCLGF